MVLVFRLANAPGTALAEGRDVRSMTDGASAGSLMFRVEARTVENMQKRGSRTAPPLLHVSSVAVFNV